MAFWQRDRFAVDCECDPSLEADLTNATKKIAVLLAWTLPHKTRKANFYH